MEKLFLAKIKALRETLNCLEFQETKRHLCVSLKEGDLLLTH